MVRWSSCGLWNCVDGMDVLDAIEACGTASGKPTRYCIVE